MSHEIDESNNRANIAFVGDVPWHGLGNQLTGGAPLNVWKKEAGLNWNVLSSPVTYDDDKGKGHQISDRVVLYRSDTKKALGVVGHKYKIVQPGEVIDFYEDLVDNLGFVLNTAGSLKGGKVIWALAETGQNFKLGNKDTVNGFLLLSTSNDKSMATRAQFTSVRVVCNNTLTWALRDKDAKSKISVTHAATFDAKEVKEQLGIYTSSWDEFKHAAKDMSKIKLKEKESLDFFANVFMKRGKSVEDMIENRTVQAVHELYNGTALGSDLVSAKGTLWGAVNSVTEYLDHHRGTNQDARLVNSWFKSGSRIKQKAVDLAMDMVSK